MTRSSILEFMQAQYLAVEASVAASGAPQAAVVGIVVTDDGWVFFDTLGSTRKAQNLRRDPRAAMVIGGLVPGEVVTVQLEGVADEPGGDELHGLLALYFARFPDGPARRAWPGLTYVRIRPTWIRYCDYGQEPPRIVELTGAALEREIGSR